MSEDPPVATEAAAPDTEPRQPSAREAARFRSMSMPSAPFWLMVIAGVIALTVVVLSWSVVFMFGIGLALFALLLPIVNWLERRGLRRTFGALLLVLSTVVIVVLLGLAAIAIFFNQIVPFVESIPHTLAEIQANGPDWLAAAIKSVLDSIAEATAGIDEGTVVLGFLKGTLGIVGTALSLTLLPFFVFYLLVDQPGMARGMHDSIPEPWRPRVSLAMRIFVDDFVRYFKAELIVGAIQGTMVTIGVFVIGLIVGPPLSDFAILLGVLAGVMELLPQIGPIISLVPALLLAFGTSPLAVVLVSVFYLIVFVIEANVLVPKIEGNVINFRPATVLFVVAIGLAIGGIIGGILALPVAAIVRDLFGSIFREAQEASLIEVGEGG